MLNNYVNLVEFELYIFFKTYVHETSVIIIVIKNMCF